MRYVLYILVYFFYGGGVFASEWSFSLLSYKGNHNEAAQVLLELNGIKIADRLGVENPGKLFEMEVLGESTLTVSYPHDFTFEEYERLAIGLESYLTARFLGLSKLLAEELTFADPDGLKADGFLGMISKEYRIPSRLLQSWELNSGKGVYKDTILVLVDGDRTWIFVKNIENIDQYAVDSRLFGNVLIKERFIYELEIQGWEKVDGFPVFKKLYLADREMKNVIYDWKPLLYNVSIAGNRIYRDFGK